MLCRLLRKFERDYHRSYRACLTASSAPLGSSISFSTQLYRLDSTHRLLIFLVAFGIRLAAMVYMQSFQIPTDQDNWKFGFETGRIAASIASGQGFSSPLQGPSGPTAWLPPIYPYMLAGIFKLFGIYSVDSALVALTLNSLFSALTCVTIFYIGRKTFGPKVATWAGWSWAFFPYAVFWSIGWVWAISLSAFLLSLLCLVALYLERCNTVTAWLGFGLLWGLVALTDTSLLSTLPFFVGWLCYRLSQQGMMLSRAMSACTLGFILILTPWMVRNYLTFGEFVFIKSNFGMELHLGNYEGSTGLSAGRLLHPAGNDREFEKFRRMGELSYIKESKGQALRLHCGAPGHVRLAHAETSSILLDRQLATPANFPAFRSIRSNQIRLVHLGFRAGILGAILSFPQRPPSGSAVCNHPYCLSIGLLCDSPDATLPPSH